jgi:hypothetical protein
MFCIHCGQTLPPEACFCPRCGRKVETSPDSSGGQSAQQTPPPKIDCGLTLAIIAVVMGNVIGIVALIYSVLASDMLRSGNYEGARRAARTGKIWSWSAIILSAIGLVLGILILPRLVELIAPGLTLTEI